jgi:hypothetical protein
MLPQDAGLEAMWQSLQDWFFRNITTITIVVPVLAFLIPNLVLLFRRSSMLTSDWLGDEALDQFTLAYKLPQDADLRRQYSYDRGPHRSPRFRKKSSSRSPWLAAVTDFISRRRRSLLIGAGVVVIFIIGAKLVFLWGDNETKARTTALAFPPPLCSRSGNSQLLIFIHGWNGDPADTWKRFPELACADPTLAGVDVIVVNYPTFATRRNLHIPALARWVNEEINKIDDGQKYKKIAIVAHSMGGLIGREMTIYRKLGDQQSIGLMVEIGTPHGGADDAKLANSLGISKDLTEEMMHDSTVLNTLTSQWFSFKKDRPYTFCLTSPQDEVVLEQSAMAFCDNGLEYPMWGHTEMVKPLDLSDTRYDRPISKIREFMSQ